MTRRIVIAVVLTILLVVAGLALQRVLFEKPAATPAPSPSATPIAAASPSPAPVTGATVTDVSGTVERQRGSTTATWLAVHAGDVLSQDDVIRTQGGGRAVLALGETATITVAEDSRVQVGEISRKVSRVRLEDGRISAVVQGKDESSLQVTFKDSDAAVAATGGDAFSALTTGDGHIAVVGQGGAVKLSAKGKTVTLAKDEQSILKPHGAPSAPAKVRPSLFVSVGKPPKTLKVKKTKLAGKAAPGSMITVAGVKAFTADDGSYELDVPLKEGPNQLVVTAIDATGRTTTAPVNPILVDTKPTTIDGTVDWNQH